MKRTYNTNSIPSPVSPMSGLPVAAQLASLPPLEVLLGGNEPIAKPPITTGLSSSRRPNSVAETPTADFVNETTVWKRIEKSLSLPAMYRNREDLSLTLRMLRRIRYFRGISEEELITISNCMKIESVATQGTVIWVKTEPEPDVLESESDSENEADELDHLIQRVEKGKQEGKGDQKTGAERGSTISFTGNKGSSPSISSSRYKSPTSAAEDHSVISGLAFPVVPYSENPVHILVRGKVILELPTINGMLYYPVLPLDTFGNELWTDPLPVGAKYLSTEPCTLVVLHPGDQKLNRVLARADRLQLEEQKRFLRDQLKVKIFESWQESDFERCAKRFVPLRLESFQLIVEEGELSDSVYFLKEGQLTVTRLVKPHPRKKTKGRDHNHRQETEAHGGHTTTSSLIRQIRDPSLSPNEHVMQVASLLPGEFFGELGLLAHNPDVRPGENVVWTDQYWRDALCNRFKLTDTVAQASLVKELRGNKKGEELGEGEEGGEENGEEEVSGAPPPASTEAADIRYPQQTTPRRATVYAQLPSTVYRFSFEDCRENIGGIALTRLMEFVKGYPAHDEIYEQFEKQLKWTVYRNEFLADVFRQNRNTQRGEHLPCLKF